MSAHTPGSWGIERCKITDYPTVVSVDGYDVCNFVEDVNIEANARLIAAAPLMLQALQQIASKDYGNAYARGCADIARAAIAAAIGDAT